MSLTLHFHPLSSFCQKVLVALYEAGLPFAPHLVDLGDPAARAAFLKLWPIGRFPVLHDAAAGRTVPESSLIIEYLGGLAPAAAALIPPEAAREVRHWDRIFDLYVNVPMQKIVTDRLRPEGRGDPQGVEEARALLATALDLVDAHMADRRWAAGDAFSMADCAAAPALFYADKVAPLAAGHPPAADYLARLRQRPSFARVLREAEPYLRMFPQG